MRLNIEKADAVLNKTIFGCVAVLGGIAVAGMVYAICYAIYINLSEFIIGALQFIGAIALIALITTICVKYAVVRIIAKGILAVAGITIAAYVVYRLIYACILGGT